MADLGDLGAASGDVRQSDEVASVSCALSHIPLHLAAAACDLSIRITSRSFFPPCTALSPLTVLSVFSQYYFPPLGSLFMASAFTRLYYYSVVHLTCSTTAGNMRQAKLFICHDQRKFSLFPPNLIRFPLPVLGEIIKLQTLLMHASLAGATMAN